MKKHRPILIGCRDIEVLNALERCPLTVKQIVRLSQSFVSPTFGDEANVRRRLRKLQASGLLNCWQYAIAGDGRSSNYFKLTQEGLRTLHGVNISLPNRRYFEQIRPAHHWHTFCLAEFIVHLSISAKQRGCTIESFARENSIALKSAAGIVYPDAAFLIRRPDGRVFPFCVEVDNSTERVRSKNDVESIERKLRTYDAHNIQFSAHDPERYVVLFVSTRSQRRLDHILEAARDVTQQPGRTVFTGCTLKSFCDSDPFVDPVLSTHSHLKRTLIPVLTDRLNTRENVKRKNETVVTCSPAGRPLLDAYVRA